MYSRNITAFDVETPNRKNDSICSIGICHVKTDGSIVNKEFLVNPEDYFEGLNSGIHGITEEMVKDAPRLPEVWNYISEYFEDSIIIAHNATFDLSVFFKTLIRYNIEAPEIRYVCTQRKAQKHIDKQTCESYSLLSLCSLLGIQLNNHHNALQDAIACAQLFGKLTDKYGYYDEDIKQYRKPVTLPKDAAGTCTKALKTLRGILLGINFDRKIYPEEYSSLQTWTKVYKQYSNYPDVQLCINRINEILSDGIITSDEYNSLLKLTNVDDYEFYFCKVTEAMQLLMGIMEGISCDKRINDMEAFSLYDWLQKYDYLNGTYPYDKIFCMLYLMLEDKHIDSFEEAELLEFINGILHPTEEVLEKQNEIIYNMNQFCLTGDFIHGARNFIESVIIDRGGLISKGVSKKIQYLIVGGLGSPKWAYSEFGEKVAKALELNEKGARIKILKECDLFED